METKKAKAPLAQKVQRICHNHVHIRLQSAGWHKNHLYVSSKPKWAHDEGDL